MLGQRIEYPGTCPTCGPAQIPNVDAEASRLRMNYLIRSKYEHTCDDRPDKLKIPNCCHLRLPNLKPKSSGCWDQDFYLPVEALKCYVEHGYIKAPTPCECLPLDAKREKIKYYEIQPDPRSFGLPYFMDPTNPHRWFKSCYLGHVPTERFRHGETHCVSTAKALNRFTINYLTPYLSESCPIYINPNQYCDRTDKFYCKCDKDKTYDGHFHDIVIRKEQHKLKWCHMPKCPPPQPCNEPLPFCIQQKEEKEFHKKYCNTFTGST